MARYAAIGDCRDPVVVVEEADLEGADRLVGTLLRNIGIDPAAVTDADGLSLLRDVAVAEATATAAQRGAVEGDSGLWKKHESYRASARALGMRVNRESLGLAVPGSGASGYASIPVGRG